MHTKEDKTLAKDRFVATMKQLQKLDLTEEYRHQIIDLACKVAKLQTKVDLYERYLSYHGHHDNIELGGIYSFDGELYRMVSRNDEQDTDSAHTIYCKFLIEQTGDSNG